MTEMALVSARKSKLTAMSNAGNKRAKTALQLIENPNRFLSTVQIGITLIGILTGLFSGATFSHNFGDILIKTGISASAAYRLAQILIIIVVTYLSIAIGELIPKKIGLAMSDNIAIAFAPAMHLLSLISLPLVWLLSKSTEIAASMLGIREKSSKVTEEEIK